MIIYNILSILQIFGYLSQIFIFWISKLFICIHRIYFQLLNTFKCIKVSIMAKDMGYPGYDSVCAGKVFIFLIVCRVVYKS